MSSFSFSSSKQYPGLKVWCKKCEEWVKDICPQDREPLKNCISTEELKFRIFVHKPGTKNGRWRHVLKATNVDDAIAEAINFRNEVLSGVTPEEIVEIISTNKENTVLFSEALARYLAIIHGEGLYSYEKKTLTTKYLRDQIRSYNFLVDVIADKYDLSKFTIEQFLTKQLVDVVYKALEADPSGDNTFDKRLDCYRRFEKWICTDLQIPLLSLFWGIERKPLSYDPLAIPEEEFKKLLVQVTLENGTKIVNYASREKEYYYKPWLVLGFRLALATGGRREEITSLRYCDIEEEDGIPVILWMENFKVNKRMKLVGKNKKYIPVPISGELKIILLELDYKKHINSDRFILAPEITENRHRMWDALTKGFHHYYAQLNTGIPLTFYSLKRTNITAQHIGRGNKVKEKPTHHAGIEVEIKHYVDKKMGAVNKTGYPVFPTTKKKKIQ